MRTITLEEHYASPGFLDGPGRGLREQAEKPNSPVGKVLAPLCDLGEQRIAAMNAAGIDVQVLSLTSPGTEQLDAAAAEPLARETNDFLAAAIGRHPNRFAGFAALPTAAPAAAAAELERTVREHGFKGAMIHGHVGGRYLDDPFFWPILGRAEALGVPIYLHPTPPPEPVIAASYAGFSPLVNSLLAGAGWGWHVETAVHVIRIILGGAFDLHPHLQLVVGHLGETLPFMLPRLDAIFTPERTKLQRPMSAYLRENVHYTISGFNFLPTFLDLFLQVGAERILFSADHPYASMAQARDFLDRLPVSAADRERIAHGNAERLLHL
jgi:predicted TIM-barrel fold metal-dependent hydrolase